MGSFYCNDAIKGHLLQNWNLQLVGKEATKNIQARFRKILIAVGMN
jgi:hypothetical protein